MRIGSACICPRIVTPAKAGVQAGDGCGFLDSRFRGNDSGRSVVRAEADMADINLINVNKIYAPDVKAVEDVNLHVRDGEFMILLGPSGCGKSTTLRMIAGLETITSGDLYLADKRINDVDPRDRNLAIVFQNYALY